MLPIQELLNLSGKVAIVTGAVGIGEGIVRRLAQAGAHVVCASRSAASIEALAAKMHKEGLSVETVMCDVSRESDVSTMVQSVVKNHGHIDILVNNAGIFPTIPVSQMTLADFEAVIKTNLEGVFLCTKYVSEHMKKEGAGGRIVNITSIDALHPSSVGLAHYDASKHGVWGFTKNVALELAPYNIWVNAVAPGGILTPGVAKMQSTIPAPQGVDQTAMLESFLKKIPMHRLGEIDEIGKVVLFLVSDMASYMTGSQIVVDGGALLG